MLSRIIFMLAAAAAVVLAGPVEFGQAELDRAIAERGLNPRALRIKTEVAVDPPDSYHIAPGLITGGDLRGLGPAPTLAGRSPSYIARQLYDMQHGNRHGAWTPLMAAVVTPLVPDDLITAAAYLASRKP